MNVKDINREIDEFKTKRIQVVPGLYFSQYTTLQTIFFYYNSKFTSGDVDTDGDRKYFYNINKNPCKIFSKAIDFDTKNIRLLTVGGGDPLKTWFMERDLKFWMRSKQFGKTLNRIFKELPIFGSVVLKVVDGTPYFVDLRNFVLEQSSDTIDDSNYIVEIHNYTVPGFRKVAQKMGWKDTDVKKVVDEFYKMKDTSHIRVYERYGDVQDPDTLKHSYRRVFCADVGIDEIDERNQLLKHTGVELSSEEWEGHPYWEFHAEKVPGRWLGVGVVESLIEPQVRQNEIANLQSKSSYWASLRIFQSRDQTVNRNLKTDVHDGEVMPTDSEIVPISLEDRNLAFFNEETQKWLKNRDELTFSYDVVQGERLPAGTPLGSAKIAITQTLSYFEQIQEDVAMDVKEMLYEVIIPSFQNKNTVEHTLRLVGQDLDEYIEMVKNDLVLKEIIRQLPSRKSIPSEDEKNIIAKAIEESIRQEKEKILTIPKNYYKDIKYDVDIDITGESVDTRVRYATKFALLQAITADPTLASPEVKKKILFSMAEDGGVNPNDFFGAEEKPMEQMIPAGRAGGGVSAPAVNQPLTGETAMTV